MSLWASAKQSICSVVALMKLTLISRPSRSVRTDFVDIGILTDVVVDVVGLLCYFVYVFDFSLHLLDNKMLT